jgi:hypothetical protein
LISKKDEKEELFEKFIGLEDDDDLVFENYNS